MMKRSLPIILGLLIIVVYQATAQPKRLTEAERKILVSNFNIILADVKNDFRTLATGEATEWSGKKTSVSKVQLLPVYFEQNKIYSIYWGMDDIDENMPCNYFFDMAPFNFNDMYNALAATLSANGFVEVQPQRLADIDTARAFRSKDAVVVFKGAKDGIDKSTSIILGKLHYYYGPNVAVVKPGKPVIKNSKEFFYKHSCGLQVRGEYISTDSLLQGEIQYCKNVDYEPDAFYGTFYNRGYRPRTYLGNASGRMPMRFEPVKGVMHFTRWGALFAGDFVEKTPNSDVIGKGYLVVNGDSVAGYLSSTSSYAAVFVFTPTDKNKRRARFYASYQGSNQPRLIYEEYTVAAEEKEWADIEQRVKDRQNRVGPGTTDRTSPENSRMREEATAARIKLFEWIRVNDKAREADVKQCIKDRGYGASVARMSGHCNRALAYFSEHNGKCYDYLKKYEKYTPSEQLSDIKARIEAVNDAMKGIR